MITAVLARGYKIKNFTEVEAKQPHLILRHDIDQCLDTAARLAELEAEQGWCASYFVLMRSEMYNPFSPSAARALEAISAGGHEIGLHLDAAIYGNDAEALEKAAGRECAMLESIAGRHVRMISFHRPAQHLQPYDHIIAGRINTYESRFFNEIGYCSDSRGGWHHGHPLDHDSLNKGHALQLLTHAIWWIGAHATAQEKLTAYLDGRIAVLESELAEHCAVYTPRQSKART
ncbi:MAG: hypothetical protein O3B21_16155 [Proteobacteria bacterium]|nr:hypothetical protein [Pseudomonadota bacterium]MDA1357669.1 hypothetical protein [Pseudomonadota bacterium]